MEKTPHCYTGHLIPKLGSSSLSTSENNDCAVSALAVAASVPYDDAHAFWELHGRKRGKDTFTGRTFSTGCDTQEFAELDIRLTRAVVGRWVADEHGVLPTMRLGDQRPHQLTLRAFARRFPKGRYLVCVRGHALAVVDGVVVDYTARKDLRRVRKAWRVERLPKPAAS